MGEVAEDTTSENSVLFAGIDGMELRYLEEFSHPFWNKIKDSSSIVEIPKPEKIKSGEIATASSPRLWSRYSTGVPPEKSGVAGFWEKFTEDGEVLRADIGIQEIRERKIEKLVDRNDLLVDPIWTVLLKNDKSVGMVTPWFSYPLQDEEKEMMGEDSFFVTDFPFPRESDDIVPERSFYPESAEPKESFEDQVAAGMRLPIFAQRKPDELRERIIKQDEDRYEYAMNQLEGRNLDFVGIYTRGVDGCQHLRRQQGSDLPAWQNIDNVNIVDDNDIKRVYDANMEGIQDLWETGKFDVGIAVSDHGSGARENREAHEWPGYVIIFGDFPEFEGMAGRYEDVPATVLDLLGVEKPEYMTGDSLFVQASVAENLRELGYF